MYSANFRQGRETASRLGVWDFGGTVLGRPIEILVADHQTKLDSAGEQARKWFDEDGAQHARALDCLRSGGIHSSLTLAA
ncbi:ABC transporter substrate-binding protein [Rhodopila sp.]|uniref:ABC transporter substrate-binding protein n=1 Tax=Rhodopila sp. TaxID=2480087 RepID=UPI003D105730